MTEDKKILQERTEETERFRRPHEVVESILPVHKAQLLSYMKLLNVPLGLLINFHVPKLTDGISRLMLPGANEG